MRQRQRKWWLHKNFTKRACEHKTHASCFSMFFLNKTAPGLISVSWRTKTFVPFTALLIGHQHKSTSSGVQFRLHRLQQQLGVLLQQSQGPGPFALWPPGLFISGGMERQRVQFGLYQNQSPRQDVSHLLLTFTWGLLALQQLFQSKTDRKHISLRL